MLDLEEMEKRLNRHYNFWDKRFEGEGAYFAIMAPDETALDKYPPIKPPGSLEQKWFDIDYRLEENNQKLNTTYFAGDAVPIANIDFGSGILASFLGSEYKLAEDTIWYDAKPIISDWNDLPKLSLLKDSEIYKKFIGITKSFCEASQGRYITSITDVGANMDVLASLRGRENLLMDLIVEPDEVKRFLFRIDQFWKEVFDENIKILSRYKRTFTSWVPIVNQKTWYPLLSEFSTMISPTMFEDIVFPAIQREADYLDQALFNLDGEDQVKYLSILLRLEGLHSIEWDPVPKYSPKFNKVIKDFSSETSIEVYKQIQSCGKKLVIREVIPEQIEPILNNISPDGVFFVVNCSNRKEADEFLTFSRKWTKYGR
ncbi:conserved hypothetical protein [Clostridiaceae bacterium BL-3]|nr:conserved hypothetical protein [Clostridiaceae bacterium BL-3]